MSVLLLNPAYDSNAQADSSLTESKSVHSNSSEGTHHRRNLEKSHVGFRCTRTKVRPRLVKMFSEKASCVPSNPKPPQPSTLIISCAGTQGLTHMAKERAS